MDFSHVMTLVVKLINSIRAKALQHRLFKSLMDELDAAHGDLILLDLIPGKKQTPVLHDKRCERVQGQTLCLDCTSEHQEANTFS